MSQTLLLGLDGATFTILDPLIEAGHMPFLRQFMRHGAHAELMSTVHPITPCAWTSMITGRTPGNHGVFDFVYCRQTADGIFFTLNMSYDIRCPTLWSILSRRGMRVAALNYPVSYPAEPMNGVCLPGVHWRHFKQAVSPPAFYDRLRTLPSFDAKLLSLDTDQEFQSIQYLPEDEYEAWLLHHIQREECWFDILRLILSDDPPDLTAVVFDGVDKLQHLCWRFLDPAFCPRHRSPWDARVLELCLKYFQQLDHFLAEIVSMAGPEARTFIASDHGFGPTEVVFFANAWLERNGYLAWKSGSAAQDGAALNIADRRIKFQVEDIHWDQTTAFALNPSSNGIYIRQAHSAGSPGIAANEYDHFRETLAAQLRAVTDPYTGGPFFSRVLTREEAFPGGASERAPDLTLIMKDNGFLSVLQSNEVFRRRSEPWGTHYPEGIFLAGGPGIAPLGRMPALQIIDIAPILLRSIGFEAEPDMEGHCPERLFQSHALPALDWRPLDQPLAAGDQSAAPEIEDEVLARLRALGYIGR